jgi:hypothetical protein
MKKSALLPLVIFSTFTHVQTLKADVLADWTFETSQPLSAGPFAPESGLQTATAQASAAGLNTISTPSGNGSIFSFSGNGWSVGDYFQFTVNTVGYAGIHVSYDQVSSSGGPSSFSLEYSTNGLTFTDAGDYSVSTSITWNSSTVKTTTSFADDLSTASTLNNAAAVYFRLINNSTVASGGTDRVDNFTVTGVAAVPEPAAIALATFGGLVCFFMTRRRH